mgnify:CR=1 FL=1
MRPTPATRALEPIIRDLIGTRDGATYFADRVWGVSLRYDLGSNDPLVGRSAPDFELVDGRKLGTLLAAGRGLFLDFDFRQPFQPLACRWSDRLTYAASEIKETLGLSAMLVRPDGIVAWVGGGASDQRETAEEVLSRWFGYPGLAPASPR